MDANLRGLPLHTRAFCRVWVKNIRSSEYWRLGIRDLRVVPIHVLRCNPDDFAVRVMSKVDGTFKVSTVTETICIDNGITLEYIGREDGTGTISEKDSVGIAKFRSS